MGRGTVHDYQVGKVFTYFGDIEYRRKRLTAKTDSGTRFQFGTPFKNISIYNIGTEDIYCRFFAGGTVSAQCAKIEGGVQHTEALMGSVVHLYARGTPEMQIAVRR